MYKILVCEDSLTLNAKSMFACASVDVAIDADDFLNHTYENSYNLYIINIYYYNVINELRNSADKTITIFVDEFYNINSLKKAFLIADEYMVKPLYIEELKIRVDYYHRKTYNKSKNIVIYKNFYFHINSKQLYDGKIKVKLSPNEVKLLELFLNQINKPLSKDIIYSELESNSDGSLRVYISKFNKLGFDISYERATFSYTLKY